MKEWILKDLRNIIDDSSSLQEFIKIDDFKEMYDYCQKDKNPESSNYTESEFVSTVEQMIEDLDKSICDDNEW